MNASKPLAPASLEYFFKIARDNNWGPCPVIDPSKEEKGMLTHLKRAKLLTTSPVGEGEIQAQFTALGVELAATRNVTVEATA